MLSTAKQLFTLIALTSAGAIISILSGLSPKPWAEPETPPGQITATDARALDAIWLDARSAEAYAAEHIPGALFYDQENPADNLAMLFPVWIENPRPIIVYCSDIGCGTSQRIADYLRENFPDAEIYALKGGWTSWQQ